MNSKELKARASLNPLCYLSLVSEGIYDVRTPYYNNNWKWNARFRWYESPSLGLGIERPVGDDWSISFVNRGEKAVFYVGRIRTMGQLRRLVAAMEGLE